MFLKDQNYFVTKILFHVISYYIDCTGSYNVSRNALDLSIRWTVRGDMIDFVVSAQTTGWLGIGFSEDPQMVITGTYYSARTHMNTHTHTHTSLPMRVCGKVCAQFKTHFKMKSS